MAVSTTVLRALPIFESVSDTQLEPIARVASLRPASRGTVVVREGDHSDCIYFVVNGSLKVQVSDDEGREVILTILGPGEIFGEMGGLDASPRSASVVATQSSDLVTMSRADFHQCLATNADIALHLMRGMAQRLRQADRNIESLALLDVFGRVARLLIDLSEERNGQRVVTRKLSKQDIAKMVGASREMVSRVMTDLRQQGLLDEIDNEIILHGECGP